MNDNIYTRAEPPGLPVRKVNVPTGATMSTRDIAELCDKRHPDVLRDVRSMFEALEIGLSSFASSYLNAQNKEQPEYLLPRDLTLTLVTGYDIRMRKRVIDRLDELERSTRPALRASAMMREARLVFGEAARIAKLAGLKDNAAILSAAMATKRATGTDPLEIVGRLHLPSPADEVMINPKTIGERLDGRSAQAANKDLLENGFQKAFRDDKKALHYEPTPKGVAAGGRMMDAGKSQGGRMIQQLLWPTSIIETLRPLLFGGDA